jgi:DNA-binding transcriptional regulator YdaS (Cro superfamily)
MHRETLERAIKIVGGQAKLAAAIGTDQPSISFWLNRAKKGVPPEYCIPIEVATGAEVWRWQLRPDVFPRPAGQSEVSAQQVA